MCLQNKSKRFYGIEIFQFIEQNSCLQKDTYQMKNYK